ncbi:MAG: twin arginine-targeting protein translocase TatC [Glaciihabitans sp.]|nr:twin arginine-targeting protein translocase TatC [Glaciihabitans sp.]
MSFGAHLVELRKRLFIAAIAFVVASVGSIFLVKYVLAGLRVPIEQIAQSSGRTASLAYTYTTEAFDVQLQIAVTLGVIISSPVWLWQIWAYIVPALKRSEKRYAVGFLGAAIPLFLAGCTTGWFIFPHTVELLAGFAAQEDASIFRVKDYVDFVLKLVIAIGVGFVLPVFLVLLNFIGVLTAQAIIKGWRVAVLLIALFAAIATPASDVVTMFLLAIPMVILYFIAAGVAWWHDRAAAKRADKVAAEIAIEIP